MWKEEGRSHRSLSLHLDILMCATSLYCESCAATIVFYIHSSSSTQTDLSLSLHLFRNLFSQFISRDKISSHFHTINQYRTSINPDQIIIHPYTTVIRTLVNQHNSYTNNIRFVRINHLNRELKLRF
ncbi:hypothetical protein QVD17_05118 [Tagetes erecta]|uniref:Uncharacterized protein n=1 Tax=Tagetes erecta TaxID=13708 RepID=A0AAD8LJ40_TARER|nr:hypothetical protein QVD17_05118 [Tagetes erecta]